MSSGPNFAKFGCFHYGIPLLYISQDKELNAIKQIQWREIHAAVNATPTSPDNTR